MGRWSLALVAVVLLSGCTTFRRLDAADNEHLLVEAGFTQQPAGTANPGTTPPYKVVRQNRDGRIRYVFVDPDRCRCAYIGGPREYAVYRERALDERVEADRAWASRQGHEAP